MVVKEDENSMNQDQSYFMEFAKSTTAHGIRNVAENSGVFRRSLWLVAFLVASGYLIFQLVTVTMDYYSYPFKTLHTITPKTSLQFPTVTICDLSIVDATKLNNTEEIKAIFRYLNEPFWYPYMNASMEEFRQKEPYQTILNQNYYQFISSYGSSVRGSFVFCSWQDVKIDCDSLLQHVLTPIGQCFRFNGNWSAPRISSRPGSKGGFLAILKTSQDGYTASEYNSVGFKIVLHDMFDFADVYSKGLLVGPGFHYDMAFHQYTYTYLPRPYKALGNRYCVQCENPESTTSRREGPYSLSECIASRAKKLADVQCDCSLEIRTYDKATSEDYLGCPYPCDSRSYWPIISQSYYPANDAMKAVQFYDLLVNDTEVRDSYLSVNLYFEDMILREYKHVPEYDSLSLFGTIGGNIGLFLGASLLTLVEVLELLVFTFLNILRKLGYLLRNDSNVHNKIGK